MDFSNVIVQEATDLVEGESEAVAFTAGDASNVVPVSPRAKPPIWDEVHVSLLYHLKYVVATLCS